MSRSSGPPPIIDRILSSVESHVFECKRIAGKVDKILETVVAFANSNGGVIALGVEDPDKATGRDRLFGLEENPTNWDEITRKIRSRITESDDLKCDIRTISCTLRDGRHGSIGLIQVQKSEKIHSIVDNGTYVRLEKSNREITAREINELSFTRGTISAEGQLEDIDLELLDTAYWKAYATQRAITRPLDQALYTIGLARRDQTGKLCPTRAAVLLFAEDPSGVLAGKTSVRFFHYRGQKISTDPNTNLVRPPTTVGGPLIHQIRQCRQVLLRELGERVQYTELGFEIVQRYPLRVVMEAITNAVVHRDYRLPSDILVRIHSDRIEVESPGLFAGPVTPQNIHRIGTYPRNKLIVQHLREFPSPPNLDAGEGVKMMFGLMKDVGLYPPLYRTRPHIEREAVVTILLNENRPSAWEQVIDYINKKGSIGNSEVRQLLGTDDTLTASKQLKAWVDQNLLVVLNPSAGRNVRRYGLADLDSLVDFFSNLEGKEESP